MPLFKPFYISFFLLCFYTFRHCLFLKHYISLTILSLSCFNFISSWIYIYFFTSLSHKNYIFPSWSLLFMHFSWEKSFLYHCWFFFVISASFHLLLFFLKKNLSHSFSNLFYFFFLLGKLFVSIFNIFFSFISFLLWVLPF